VRTTLLFAGLALTLAVPNALIVQKERLLERGTPVLLELAPVDPRSLIQGDYMRLDYAMTRPAVLGGGRDLERDWPPDGHLVIALDSAGVARFVRRDDGTPRGAGERLLRYRRRGWAVRVGTDAFHFQEGHADRYQGARYGELRVDASGESVLVGLRDAERRPLE
jgi:uncharacterized membrane-anchored protein